MSFTRTYRLAALLACLLLAPGLARAGDFVDTRLTFLFTDEDLLHAAGETQPSSPGARFGPVNNGGRGSTLFFDNYETKYTGFETLTNLVLYKRDESYFKNVITEAALVVTMLTASGGGITLADSSSYVRLRYKPDGWSGEDGLSFTGFPVSADRFRLGYSYRLSWGGDTFFPARAIARIPGAKLQFSRGPVYAFAGMKSALINEVGDDEQSEQQTNYGWLAGAGWDILDFLRWEVGGGLFQRGVIPRMPGEATQAVGASSQLTLHVGMPVGASVDFKLYRNDPELYQRFFQPENYPGGLSYSVSVEGNYLTQNLQDPDALASTVRQAAMAGDVQARVKLDKLRVHSTASYRDLAYVLFNVPSLVPFQDFAEGMETEPEFFIAAGLDYYFEQLHLTPGIIGGFQLPAAVTTDLTFTGTNPAPTQSGRRTVVVRDEGSFSILPEDAKRELIYSAKATARLDLSDSMAAAGEVFYAYDPNRATIAQNQGSNQPVRVFVDPDQLGFNLLLQARF